MGLAKRGGALLERMPKKLSELPIDAEKDWETFGITNLKELSNQHNLPIELERKTETQANWALGTLVDVEAIVDALVLESTGVETEDTHDTANLTGSSYTVIYNRMEFKAAGTLTKVKVKTKDAGDYTLRIKSDDGGVTYQTITISGAPADAWITFMIVPLSVAIGDKYRMEVTRPDATVYADAALYDGTLWKNIKAGFGGAEFVWTCAMGFIFATYDLSGSRVAPPLDMSTITDVDSSIVEWTETLPAGTTIAIKFAINNNPLSPPLAGDYVAATNGNAIPGISEHDDLTGLWLWAKMELSTPDPALTPKLENMREYILSNETTPIIGPMQTGDLAVSDVTRLIIISPGSIGTNLITHDWGNLPTWGYPP